MNIGQNVAGVRRSSSCEHAIWKRCSLIRLASVVMPIQQVIKSYIKRRVPYFYHYFIYARRKRNLKRHFARFYEPRDHVTFEMEDRDAGFFSLYFQVLGAIDFCKRTRCNLVLNFNSGLYVDSQVGPNWWEYYFEGADFISGRERLSIPRLLVYLSSVCSLERVINFSTLFSVIC